MAHKHGVYDSDAYFSIDPFTRVIKNESANKTTVIQYDHNSERFTFELPRKIEGHDMAACDRVEVHYINVDSSAKLEAHDIYEIDDLQVNREDNEKVICSWLLSQNATQYAGSLNFLLRFVCLDEEGKVAYAWHTAVHTGVSVTAGIMNNAEEIIQPYVDVLAQWKADLFGVGDTEEQRLLNVSQEQQAAIDAKGEAVLASIPNEYAALSALADQNARSKAGAIVLDAEGESIVVNDASDGYVQGLKLFGKSTQDGTPTPDAPVEIVSVENPAVRVCGKNLLKNVAKNSTSNGITFTVNEDGSVTVNGTATAGAWMNVTGKFTLPKGIYILSGCPKGGAYSSTYVLSATTAADYGNGKSFTIEEETEIVVNIGVYTGFTANNLTFYPMIRLASIEDDTYEPYKEMQPVPISHTLPGIPVTSGGNYTDANGQQWICDEVDFERGVYVQRLEKCALTGAEPFEDFVAEYNTVTLAIAHKNDTNILCSHSNLSSVVTWANTSRIKFVVSAFGASTLSDFKNVVANNFAVGTPVTILYVIPTPIETALSDAELNAYKALHTNKPTTTILNDAGAHMKVQYVADTKTYIDNLLKGE